jgi:hypothetical protein
MWLALARYSCTPLVSSSHSELFDICCCHTLVNSVTSYGIPHQWVKSANVREVRKPMLSYTDHVFTWHATPLK